MEQQPLEQKNITISGIKDVGWGISLEDEKGLKYNVPKNLKDSTVETKAFQVLKVLPGYGMGMKKMVKFATVPNSQGGQSRYVRIISEPGEVNQQTPPINNAPLKQTSVKQEKEEEKWDRISWGKCKTLFLVEAFKMGKPLKDAESEAEEWANASMRTLKEAEKDFLKTLEMQGMIKPPVNSEEIPELNEPPF